MAAITSNLAQLPHAPNEGPPKGLSSGGRPGRSPFTSVSPSKASLTTINDG